MGLVLHIMDVNMSDFMTFHSKDVRICERCKTTKKVRFYNWISTINKTIIGIICYECALLESFGSNYRNNKNYQRFKGEAK